MKRARRSSISDNEEEREIRRRKRWNEESEEYLIQLWYHNVDILRKTRKTSQVYREFSKEMANEGYNFTPLEIQTKIHNLTNKYKLEKRQLSIKGGTSEWRFFAIVHKIHLAYTKPLEEDTALVINDDEEVQGDTTQQYYNENSVVSNDEMDNSNSEKKVDIKNIINDESMFNNEEISNNSKSMFKIDSTRVGKHKRENSNNKEIIEMLKNCQEIMQREAEDRQKSDTKMLQLQKELIAIERERNELLRELLA
ncbi:uncharacterized protein [Musca autumnalis]|uniref:uncharacterized protein n=1 Tax=Musca autumnalis TaxID=221902 RepID=UPI003CF1468D